jgi:hypothetical protein
MRSMIAERQDEIYRRPLNVAHSPSGGDGAERCARSVTASGSLVRSACGSAARCFP